MTRAACSIPTGESQRGSVAARPGLSRRAFLGAAVVLVGAGAATVALLPRERMVATWQEILLDELPLTHEALRSLSASAAESLGEQPGDLVAGLPACAGVRWRPLGAASGAGAEAADEEIAAAIAADYAAGRIRTIDRWVLSETESRMLALFHLGRGPA